MHNCVKRGFISFAVVLSLICSIFSVNINAETFSDINNHWAFESIVNFISKGYVKGYEDGSFRPDNNISRAEFATLVNNVFHTKLLKKSSA